MNEKTDEQLAFIVKDATEAAHNAVDIGDAVAVSKYMGEIERAKREQHIRSVLQLIKAEG